MADRKSYGDDRWVIVYGSYDGVEKYAVNELYKIINGNVPYILTLKNAQETGDLSLYNVVFIGTTENNRYLREYAQQGLFTPNEKAQGFCIKTMESPMNTERKITILCGADARGVLYAVRDYRHFYVDAQRFNHFNTVYNDPVRVFMEKMPDWEYSSAPHFLWRGAWSWGHVIYDYRRYIDHMSEWKMNLLTLWNDHVPVNARDVVEYAHARGISVVWGYSWCWGETVDPDSAADLEKWSTRIIETYEKEYRPLGVDGVYFQTFTEHADAAINGKSTAALAAEWVNKISARLLDKYPQLWVQFGLHATSVRTDLPALRTVDPRLSIIWEDAGAFPFHHDPRNIEQCDETIEFTKEITRLRGEKECSGVVFKGLTMLNWLTFEHQKGPFVLGEADETFQRQYDEEHTFIWQYANDYWARNLDVVLDTMSAVETENCAKPPVMSVLLEDGAWECAVQSAGALFAEAAWNPFRSAQEILEKVGLAREVRR